MYYYTLVVLAYATFLLDNFNVSIYNRLLLNIL